MENITIRDYKSEDYDQVQYVWEKSGVGGAHRGDDKQIIEQSIKMGGRLLILEDLNQNKILGTSWMTFDGRRIHLHHIGVLPELQNKGYGTLLTRRSIQHAKAKGYQIKLEVSADNTKAISLYKKLGFNRLGDYDIYIIRDFSWIDV
ncbi:MAG: GNAT family N-acetyltransferase [Bacteroidales bacterium]